MENMTIKQIADQLGVSKQAIRYHLQSLPPKYVVKDGKGKILIKGDGIRLLSLKMEKDISHSTGKKVVNDRQRELLFDQHTVDILNEQLKVKDKQIAELTKMLDQQQQLSAMQQQQILLLEDTSNAEKKTQWWRRRKK